MSSDGWRQFNQLLSLGFEPLKLYRKIINFFYFLKLSDKNDYMNSFNSFKNNKTKMENLLIKKSF